jgi:hypothetical protein
VECASKLQKEYAVGVPLNHRLVNRLEIRVEKFFLYVLGYLAGDCSRLVLCKLLD